MTILAPQTTALPVTDPALATAATPVDTTVATSYVAPAAAAPLDTNAALASLLQQLQTLLATLTPMIAAGDPNAAMATTAATAPAATGGGYVVADPAASMTYATAAPAPAVPAAIAATAVDPTMMMDADSATAGGSGMSGASDAMMGAAHSMADSDEDSGGGGLLGGLLGGGGGGLGGGLMGLLTLPLQLITLPLQLLGGLGG